MYETEEDQSKRFYQDQLYTKSEDWSYEKEWRVVIPLLEDESKEYKFFSFNPLELKEIYFGCNMDANEVKYFRYVVEKFFLHTKMHQMVISDKEYSLKKRHL